MKRIAVIAVALVVAALAVGATARGQAVRTIHITIRHSRFVPDRIAVRHGERVRFVVRNTDPIDHEFIVGPEPIQLLHEYATEMKHSGGGAISIPLFSKRATTYTFSSSGPSYFACHLPGHWRFGMEGAFVFERTHH